VVGSPQEGVGCACEIEAVKFATISGNGIWGYFACTRIKFYSCILYMIGVDSEHPAIHHPRPEPLHF